MCGLDISELKESTNQQRVAGMLLNFNVRQGRQGRYAFATLDDTSARLEVSIWSDTFDTFRNALKKGQVIVVEGVVEKDRYSSSEDETSYKMIAQKIYKFHQATKEYLKQIKFSI